MSESTTPQTPNTDNAEKLSKEESKESKVVSEERPTKRQRSDDDEKDILDVCKMLNMEPSARLEMKWDVDNDGNKSSHWWGAELQEWDGRYYTVTPEDGEESAKEDKSEKDITDKVTVPLRKLKYDAYPEGGYTTPTLVEVCFLSPHALYDLEQRVTVSFREAGSTWEEENETTDEYFTSNNAEEKLRAILDTVLQSALSNVQTKKNINAAQQCIVADKICDAKERLVSNLLKKIENNDVNVITPDIIHACMQEVAGELRNI